MSHYDAVLWVSFGGPRSKAEVMPFLRRVVAGKHVPEERLLAVAEHYDHMGGKSPIVEANARMIANTKQVLTEANIMLPVYEGNRNAEPFLEDAFRQMQADGVRKVIGLCDQCL